MPSEDILFTVKHENKDTTNAIGGQILSPTLPYVKLKHANKGVIPVKIKE
jgi:hypothetical protein